MLIVPVKNVKELDRALKTLKSKVNKTGLMTEIRERKEYLKPSVIKREQKKNAIYVQKIRNNENN